MAKDPATLWYWNDWQGGTVTLTRHLKGCYIDLLHAQFNNGRMSLSQIKTVLGVDFANAWPTLQAKFKKDENDNFYNERAEIEKVKREKFTESRKKNLKTAHMDKHMKPHMEDRNKNRNEVDNWDSIKTNFLNAYEWKEDFCRKKNIQMPELEKLMIQFIGDIELGEEYKPLNELKSHFKNKFNLNKNGTNRQSPAGANKGLGNKSGGFGIITEALKGGGG